MLDYLKKFSSLPLELRQKVSNPKAMATIEILEKKYQFLLGALVMKVLVKEIDLADLVSRLKSEKLPETAAIELARELKEKIFFPFADYLSAVRVSSVSAGQAARRTAETKAEKAAVEGASFFFSVDDEAEIRELTKKIDLAAELPLEAVENKLEAIIERAQINFGSANLADRFRQILKTYLRGIRNKLDTKTTLVKPFLSGGLSFDEASAQQVMDITDKVLNSEPDELIKPLPKIEVTLPERDAPYDFSKLTKAKKPAAATAGQRSQPAPGDKTNFSPKQTGAEFKKLFLSEDTEHVLAPLAPAAVKPGAEKASLPPSVKKPSPAPPKKKAEPAAESQAADLDRAQFIRRRFDEGNSTSGQKVKIEDVKYVPKVMSPLDEIKYLDLVNFRRLDKDPLRAAEKVRTKINLLTEESYSKRLEGVKWWRSSPVNKLYLEIGQKSISANKPLDVIIEERKIAGGDYLTAAEFEAIMDLNKSLRF